MNSLWRLPVTAQIGGREYKLHTDFRDILEIFSYLEDPDLPELLRWQIAVALFFEERIPEEDQQAAMEYLADFIRCGSKEEKPGPKLLDWQQDAPAILADINRVSGQEVRGAAYIHWWTFLSWFHAIGEGQVSALVGIRDKLRRGKRLEGWEKDFYRENRQRVELKKRYSRQELQEQERLQALLGK